ncbi:MAG: sodium:solute symporter family protein, partial [Puniceicoccales bacterium]
MILEFSTVIIYFIFLIVIGVWVSKMNTSVGDYVYGGGKGTWWIVGTSIFMGGISAFTFTGNASAAYSAGPTFLVIYLANTLGFALCMFLGPWFRQTRAQTWADVLRERYGVQVEQFSGIIGIILSPLSAGVQLYALSVFASSILGVPVIPLIIVLGGIAITYSTTGGKWAVMATDFVQGLLMMAMTVLVCYLSLKAVGGWEAFFSYFKDPRFLEDFKFVKEPGEFYQDRYSLKWILVIFFVQVSGYINLSTAGRFLSVKDGKGARNASLLAAVLMLLGSVIWFVPPMVARFLFEADVNALDIKEPATASYSFIAQKLLPNGVMGLMLAAMFAATMSSLDTGLNGTTGVVVKNVVPWFRKLLKMEPLSDKKGLRLCQFTTLVLGAELIAVACLFARQEKLELFDAMLMVGAVIGVPLGLPVLLGLWVKRIYWVSYFVILGVAMVPSIYFTYDQITNGAAWSIQDRMIWLYVFGLIGLAISLPLWKKAPRKTKEQIDHFFKQMHEPVDFEKEVGEGSDFFQLKMIG